MCVVDGGGGGILSSSIFKASFTAPVYKLRLLGLAATSADTVPAET